MSEIRSKREFYNLYNRGRLGNKLRNWTWDDWFLIDCDESIDGYPVDPVAARCTALPGAPMRYDLPASEALDWVSDMTRKLGITPTAYQFAELAPDEINTLQGELMRDERGLYLYYTLYSHGRMRETMQNALHVSGLQALNLLRAHLDATSYDMVMDLLEEYPDSIIEFCAYEKPLGVLGINTVIWEVRNY